jgi:ribosomal protein S18 acetylase RimI-like enzyme
MITLNRPSPQEFGVIREHALGDYTCGNKVGTWPSAEIAQKEFDRLFPEGLAKDDHHLFSIKHGDSQVGFLLLAVIQRATGPEAFVLDLVIFQAFRRKGYAEEALRQVERYAAGLGLDTISLSVFDHNKAAQALYQKLEYVPVFTRMTKKL